jgi:hypothetical protein
LLGTKGFVVAAAVVSGVLDIVYIQVHSKSYVSRKTKTSYNLEWSMTTTTTTTTTTKPFVPSTLG